MSTSTPLEDFTTNPEKRVLITDFLTDSQIARARAIYKRGGVSIAQEIDRQIISPNLPAINRKLGQENNPRFLAYACEYVFSQMPK